MNLENYKTFLDLAMTESFSRTAEHMNIVQSTVSSRILELEKYLDIKLFNRTNRKVEITSAGRALIPYANKLIEIENEGKKHIQSTNIFEDCLKICVPGSVYRERLSPVIDEFYNQFQKYSMDIRLHKTSMQIEMLMNDEADIGFISRVPNTSKLKIMPYLEYSWILVTNADYNITDTIDASELTSINLCFNNLNVQYNEWLEDVLPKNFTSRININSTAQLIEYVKKGYGCAFLPRYAIEDDLKAGRLKEVKIRDVIPNKFFIYIAINRNRKDSSIVKKFLDLIPELDEYRYNIL